MSDTVQDGLWSALPAPALILDGDDTIVAANPAAESFLNLSSRAIVARPVWDVIAIDTPPEAALARARAQGATLVVNDAEMRLAWANPVAVTVHVAPYSAEAGQMLMLVTPYDAAGRLESRGARPSTAKSAIGMADMLAHEIKNPLAGITGAAQLLSMSLSEEDRELTDLIVAESRRIVALLDHVEQFGDVRPPVRRPVNLHDVLDRAKKSALLGVAADMRMTESYDPSLPDAHGDADQLLQVVLNLIKNAAEAATGGSGTITLRSYFDHGMRLRDGEGVPRAVPLQIEVEDDGPGLPEDIAGDVFAPFVSGRENGTGLGLALANKIITAHEGLIGVVSAPGRTVFRLSLPVAPRETKGSE